MGVRGAAAPRTPRCIGPLAVSACLRPALPCLARPDLRPALPCLVRPRPRLGPRPLVVSACLVPPLYPPASGPRSPAWSGLVPGLAPGLVPGLSLYPPASGPSLYPPASGPRSPAWSGLVPGPRPRLGPGLVPGLPCGYVLISHARQSPMSHVIPLHIFQTLKSDRWNCNVCGPSRKMTELNYVRLLGGTHQPRTNPFPAPTSHTLVTQKCRT